MPHQDAFGYALTLEQPAALTPWRRTVAAFLAHSADTPRHLTETLETAPEFALAWAAKGYFLLLLGRRELLASAREACDAASREAGALSPRERAYVAGLRLYLDGAPAQAAELLDAALRTHPRDTLLMKLIHAIRFVLGDAAGMRRSIEAVIGAHGADHPTAGYLNGCYAFALEETGEYLAAERRGRDALVLAPDDAWGLHAVAHVYDMTNRCTEGVAWIANQPDAWAHCNNFSYHVWWHLALFHLDRGEYGRVLELYDTRIRAEHTDDYRDISNAASLLTRLELDGVCVGQRWEELAAISATRTEDGCVVFADLHYLLALGRNGREEDAAKLLAALRANSRRRLSDMDRVAATAGLPAAEGLQAFARGDYACAVAHLTRARPGMRLIGGSHAQRDVFERIGVEAALRAGLLDEAQRMLQERTLARGALDRYAERRLARIAELRDGERQAVAAE